jgi:hypothetical protein
VAVWYKRLKTAFRVANDLAAPGKDRVKDCRERPLRYGRSPKIGMHMIANASASTGMISRGLTMCYLQYQGAGRWHSAIAASLPASSDPSFHKQDAGRLAQTYGRSIPRSKAPFRRRTDPASLQTPSNSHAPKLISPGAKGHAQVRRLQPRAGAGNGTCN